MKKTKTILAIIIALTMTACTDTNTAEVSDLPDITESSTVLTEDTTTAEETTTTTTTTAEITTVSETETETQIETTEAEQDDDGILDLSNYSGNFYDWEFVEDMTVYDRKDFSVSDETMALAIEAVRESKGFIEQKETFEAKENIDDEKYKKAFDENGNAIIEFNSGVYEDFDGDGKKEAFIVLESYLVERESDKYIYTVFANSDGDVEFIEGHSDRYYCELKCIRYNEFMHLYIHSGWFASNEDLDVYAVENGKAVPVWNCGEAYDIEKISDSVFLYGTATRQVEGYSLFFWNDELKKYCALVGEKISDEDMPQCSKIQEDKYCSDYDSEVTGGKYYNLTVGSTYCLTYIKVNGGFVESEIDVRGDNSAKIIDYVTPIPVKGINIDEAESKAIKINN